MKKNIVFYSVLLCALLFCNKKDDTSASNPDNATLNLSEGTSTSVHVAAPVAGNLLIGGLQLVGTKTTTNTSSASSTPSTLTSSSLVCQACADIVHGLEEFQTKTRNSILITSFRVVINTDLSLGVKLCSNLKALKALEDAIDDQINASSNVPPPPPPNENETQTVVETQTEPSETTTNAANDVRDKVKFFLNKFDPVPPEESLKNCTK